MRDQNSAPAHTGLSEEGKSGGSRRKDPEERDVPEAQEGEVQEEMGREVTAVVPTPASTPRSKPASPTSPQVPGPAYFVPASPFPKNPGKSKNSLGHAWGWWEGDEQEEHQVANRRKTPPRSKSQALEQKI